MGKNPRDMFGINAAAGGNLGSLLTDDKMVEMGPCPSGCGGTIHYCTVNGREAISHSVPFCRYFGDTDPERVVHEMALNVGLT